MEDSSAIRADSNKESSIQRPKHVSPPPNANVIPSNKDVEQLKFSHLTLDEWIGKFGRIYGKRHDKHTTEYMISRLVEGVAELVSPMEAQDRSTIGPSLADVFSWICSLAYKLKIDLSSLAWEKYGKNAPRPRGFPE